MKPDLSVSSFAKINLGLRLLRRRADGYHEVRTVLQTIDLADELHLTAGDDVSLSVEGPFAIPRDESNLVMKAARALGARYPGHGAHIRLFKRIPPQSGLGGGSANAAATLLALDRLWGLDADPGLLYALARDLGSDVPFFLYGGACLGVGRGDEIYPLPDLPAWGVVVAWPGVGLATESVYARFAASLTRSPNLSSMKGFVPSPGPSAPGDSGPGASGPAAGEGPAAAPPEVDNDLEETAFEMLPAAARLKARLLEAGAVAAALSGSGSAVFGLFPPTRAMDRAAASLLADGAAAYVCRTLTRDAYRSSLFRHSEI